MHNLGRRVTIRPTRRANPKRSFQRIADGEDYELSAGTQAAGGKKAAYPEYRQTRDEMRELLTIQSNVDKIFDTGAREAEKEKEQERR